MLAPSASLSVASSSLFVTITTGSVGRDLAQLAKGLEPALARHLLVEEHEVVRPPAQHLDGVVGVRGRVDVVAFVSQENAVRLEELRLVVHPQDALRWKGHEGNVIRQCGTGLRRRAAQPSARKARQRESRACAMFSRAPAFRRSPHSASHFARSWRARGALHSAESGRSRLRRS